MSDDTSLAPDADATSSRMRGLAESVYALSSYASAVNQIDTDPMSFNTGGITGTVDPFSTLPDFKAAVVAAQSHVQGWAPLFVGVIQWIQSVQAFAPRFSSDAESILSTITAIGTQTPSSAQRQTIQTAFADISSGVDGLHDGITSLQTMLAQFTDFIPGDHAALTAGPADVMTAIGNVQAWFSDHIPDYTAGLGGLDIEVIAELNGFESQIVTAMQTAQTQLQSAVTISNDAVSSASTLLDATADLSVKAKSVVTFVTAASDADLASAVQRIELRAAEASWTQLGQYINTIITNLQP